MTRLIDADNLKKKLQYVYSCDYIDSKSKEGIASDIIDEIDNAPTVKVPENEVNCVLTMFGECSYNETGCSDCEIKEKISKALENEKPQGNPCANCQEFDCFGCKVKEIDNDN